MDLSLQLYSKIQNTLSSQVYIHGGSAAYFHIYSALDQEIEIRDIDFSVISRNLDFSDMEDNYRKSEEEYNLLQRITYEFCLENNCSYEFRSEDSNSKFRFIIGYIILTKDDKESLPLNYFINQQEITEETQKLMYRDISLNVINLESVKETENYYLEVFKDLRNSSDESERENSADKLPRKIIICNLLSII